MKFFKIPMIFGVVLSIFSITNVGAAEMNAITAINELTVGNN